MRNKAYFAAKQEKFFVQGLFTSRKMDEERAYLVCILFLGLTPALNKGQHLTKETFNGFPDKNFISG